jgi:Ca-activated chloride channel family protein
LALILLITALARPQTAQANAHSHIEGIAIQLVLDTSLSMGYTDYSLNDQTISRMDAARHAIRLFVKGDPDHGLPGRTQDQIGLVGFNRHPDVLCPLTHSHDTLLASLDDVSLGPYTNIGDGLAWGLDRLRRATPKQKIVILLSDGKQNAPDAMNPQAAAKLASDLGIRVYAIGAVGNQGGNAANSHLRLLSRNAPGDSVDEETLRRVAAFTRGKYFRATDTEGLLAIYREIDQMEKCRIELAGTVKRDEWFVWPLLAGFVVLALEGLLGATRFLVVG